MGEHRDSSNVRQQPGGLDPGRVRPPPIPLERQLLAVSPSDLSVVRVLLHTKYVCTTHSSGGFLNSRNKFLSAPRRRVHNG